MLHIIHLPHRTDRWNILLKQLESQNIKKFKIWDGIIDSRSGPQGVYQAHRQIIRYAKQQNLPYIAIAEDDISLNLPETGHFDRNLRGLGLYIVCDPMVAFQYDGYSDNRKEFVSFQHYRKDKNWFGR